MANAMSEVTRADIPGTPSPSGPGKDVTISDASGLPPNPLPTRREFPMDPNVMYSEDAYTN